jgi:hypothetical protein
MIKKIIYAGLVAGFTVAFALGMFILNDVNADVKHNATMIEKKQTIRAHDKDVAILTNRLDRIERKQDESMKIQIEILREVKK